ncbi:MAG TPA: S-methyl-5'-thioinosine phosphorylase [Gammaproteobacteria bacterium]|nr:S-methyl-5'-thioinosine phosphorylase [Gammaproteobacteria bacterium]
MQSNSIAIIGGTGLARLRDLAVTRRETLQTPYGEPSSALTTGSLFGREVVFLARHGDRHTIPPHRVNYRANLWALKNTGISQVVSVCAVGGISQRTGPGVIVIPDQIIDYTWGREHTLFEDDLDTVTHIDFTEPYCEDLRHALLAAAGRAGVDVFDRGTYGATQGPRLETAAEIDRMARDGCDIVGMTGMPEASLARELGLCYAACAVSVNAAAGRGTGAITMEAIEATLADSMSRVLRILEQAIIAES